MPIGRTFLWPLLASIASLLLGVALGVQDTSVLTLGCLVVAISAATIGTITLSARRGEAFSLLSMTALFYFVAFGVGGAYAWAHPDLPFVPHFTRDDLVVALLLALLAWGALLGGYALDLLRPALVAFPKVPIASRSEQLLPTAVSLVVLGWCARLAQFSSGHYFHVQTGTESSRNGASWFLDAATHFPTLAMAIVAAEAFASSSRSQRSPYRRGFLVLLAMELLWYLPTGSKSSVLGLAGTTLAVRYYAAGRAPSPRNLAVAVVVALFLFFPFAERYRSVTYQDHPFSSLVGAAAQTFTASPSETFDAGIRNLSRVSDIAGLARVVHVGRSGVSHSPGEIVSASAEAFVPRAILPGKSDPGVFGNDFGRAYGFLGASDYSTAIGVTWVGELYIAADWSGVLAGMLIVGALLRLVDDYLVERRRSRIVLAVYATVLPWFVLGGETTIAVGLAGTVKATAFLLVVAVVVVQLAGIARDGQPREQSPFASLET